MRLAEVSVTLGEGHTEQQIAYALKQAELGTPVEEVCRKMGISDAAFYNWKKKCMDCVADALFDGRRLCALTVVDN